MTEPPPPPPDVRDWTFVIEQRCPECGFDPATVDVREGFGERVRDATATLGRAATAPAGSDRPAPEVWSALEYAAHVRDVCAVFGERVELMRTDDGVRFANWDQDTAALEGRYWELDPSDVASEVAAGAERIVGSFAALTDEEWQHRGVRSNGSAFTTATLARYFLHDLEHHAYDVAGVGGTRLVARRKPVPGGGNCS